MSITKIDKTCVVKHQILIGDQLIGVNDDYFRDCAYSFWDVIQLIKNKQSNPVRILTFQRYKKDKIWYIVWVMPHQGMLQRRGITCKTRVNVPCAQSHGG